MEYTSYWDGIVTEIVFLKGVITGVSVLNSPKNNAKYQMQPYYRSMQYILIMHIFCK